MVAKRAVPEKQNTSRIEAGLQPVSEAFQEAMEQCAVGAEPEAVHRVRTGTRRLQAMIESTTPARAFGKLTKSRLRQLKKIRRAAGPVRDLDVQRKLLENWIKEEDNPALSEQATKLDQWLKDRREDRARLMQKAIVKPRQRLAEMGALPTFAGAHRGEADSLAMEFFARAAHATPHLDAENLHDFRKAVKKARYIAEAGAVAGISPVTKALKRIQDAIGEWHDWLCLRQDARQALGNNAPELNAALDAEVQRHFALAISTVESTRGKLLGEWQTEKRSPLKAAAPRGRRTA